MLRHFLVRINVEIIHQQKENEEAEVSVAEYWQVRKNGLSTTMELFLRLFLLKSGVTQKKKFIKWMTLNKKVIQKGILTRTQFDSRVEDLGHKLHTIEAEIMALVPDIATANKTDEAEFNEAT